MFIVTFKILFDYVKKDKEASAKREADSSAREKAYQDTLNNFAICVGNKLDRMQDKLENIEKDVDELKNKNN